MKTKSILLSIYSLFSASLSFSQPRMLLINGYLHVGNGSIIETAAVGLQKGKISLVRNALAYTYSKEDWDTIIDLKGQHIYPGFFAANSTLGLTEIDAVRATRDDEEIGQFNPHIRSQIAYNAESKIISTVRSNGILLTQSTPRGGQLSGSSSLMATSGWNWEDATILSDDGIHVYWPDAISYNQGQGSNNQKEKIDGYEQQKDQLIAFFSLASAYTRKNQENQTDTRLNAMIDCFKGTKRVYFHADRIQQILDIIDFSKKFSLPFPVIVGGYESYLITRKLKDAKIPVMLNGIHSLPENETDPIDLPFRLPKILQDGEVLFCITPHGDMEAMNARNLPFLAGSAWSYGLTEEQAVASISKNVCDITGLGKQYGTIEEGKSATLVVSRGNALDVRTNHITLALVNGQPVDLSNFQEELYKRYSRKYSK